jgi:threonine synthase
MDTTPAFAGLACLDCGASHDPDPALGRCPDCGGRLDPTYDGPPDPDALSATSLFDCGAPLPLSGEAVATEPGGTPLVECPAVATELDAGSVYVKDEGRNPSGSLADRGMALAVAAAAAAGASDVALPTTGDAGQAAAAHATRARLDSHAFVPSRAPFTNKAMINVHGGDMNVVGDRYPDAVDAFEEAIDDPERNPNREEKEKEKEQGEIKGKRAWYSVRPFDAPYVHEGAKTLLYEVVADLGRTPDHVVLAAAHGDVLYGVAKAGRELDALGYEAPALHAAQAAGCAPLVAAFEADDEVAPWADPDTICGGIEVPAPEGGDLALDAVRESGGEAVSVADEDILRSAIVLAQHEGLAVGPSAAAAASGAWELAAADTFGPDETAVLVNAAGANKASDVLRSHLMGRGI